MSREMKNSHIGWMGKVPSNWDILKLKYLCKMQSGDNLTSEDIADNKDDNHAYPVYGGNGLRGYYSSNTNDGIHCLIGRQGALAGNVHLVNGAFWATDHAIVTYTTRFTSQQYLFYLLTAMDLNQYAFDTAAQPGLAVDKLKNMHVVLPPVKTQNDTVIYLTAHCSSIDSAISKHQQIIEKLEEYRKAVITQAVTNGLNPNVEMKDSGDSIIPIVPSHWLWTRVKFTVNVVRGGSPRPIEQYIIGEKEDGYNWIKIGDATGGGKFIIATKQRIKPDGLNKTRLVHAGTLLLTNSMSFGHPYFLQIDGCIHDGWLAFSDYKGVLPAFLYYYLMSETTAHQFTTTADGSVVQNLNIDKVRNSHIALPPIVEQKAIVQYLDTVDGKINTAIQHHNQIIEKLQEYKQSLIYNAVTGKIDCTTEA